MSLRFANNPINRESPIQCHFELLKPIPDYVLWSRSRIYIYNSIKLILIKHSTKGLVSTNEKKHNGTLLAYVATGIIHFKKAKCLRWSFASLCKNDDLVQWRHWVIRCPRLRAKTDQGPGIPAQEGYVRDPHPGRLVHLGQNQCFLRWLQALLGQSHEDEQWQWGCVPTRCNLKEKQKATLSFSSVSLCLCKLVFPQ